PLPVPRRGSRAKADGTAFVRRQPSRYGHARKAVVRRILPRGVLPGGSSHFPHAPAPPITALWDWERVNELWKNPPTSKRANAKRDPERTGAHGAPRPRAPARGVLSPSQR